MHRQKKQNTPRRRTRKNEDDGSLPFFHRPPESGLILNRSCIICVIYDGGRPPDTGHVTKSRLLIGYIQTGNKSRPILRQPMCTTDFVTYQYSMPRPSAEN